jgi:hypothetical protein
VHPTANWPSHSYYSRGFPIGGRAAAVRDVRAA